jgi:integrase
MTALEQLSHRTDFTAPNELVFCNVATGRALDGSALRRRYKQAQPIAGVHPMRWHDLRHTYGSLLAANGEELITIKTAMGHANITTTEHYLHARPATEQAKRFTQAFRATGSVVGYRPEHKEVALQDLTQPLA